MARGKVQEPDSDTTVVNIADFQRTRDSAWIGHRHLHLIVYMMKKGGHITLGHDHLAMVVANEQGTIEMVHALTNQLTIALDAMKSGSFDHHSLTKTYQKVIVALATLQNSVQDLSKAYINHANTVLNPGRAGTLDLNLTNTLLESGLLTHRAPSPGMKQDAPVEAKKKRKRAAHDPNAPKRALTPYFLYMQSARPQIAQELGTNAKPKEVADEGTRRWGIMPEADKNVWNAAYQKNLAVYRIKTAAYKAGKSVPSDEDAEVIAHTDTSIAAIPVAEEEVEEEEEEPEVGEEEEESESSPEPVRAPSPPKSSKRRKTGEKRGSTPVKENAKAAAAAKSSPEKEKKGKKAKKEPTPPPAPKAADKKKKSKKA